jgi:hypothetical protein
VRPRKGTPQAVDIYHPALMLLGISSVIVMDIDFPVHDASNDSIRMKFKCEEYVGQGAQKAKSGTVDKTAHVGNGLFGSADSLAGQRFAPKTPVTVNAKPTR